jgi:DNA helicase II / ATP-dependent DNA helicase PcrA
MINQQIQQEEKVKAQILDNLNNRQREAVESTSGETLVIAGAGSGKTAVLTRRCAYLIVSGVNPGSILSLTFTNKAAAEMNSRMRKLLSEIGIYLPEIKPWQFDYTSAPLFCTFHSLGLRLLREFGEATIELKKEFNILDNDDQTKIIRTILKEMNLDPKEYTPRAMLSFITQCKQELLTPENSKELARDYLPVFHNLYSRYWASCRTNQVVDFDDLILLPYLMLKNFPEVLDTVRNRWNHIQVDEFQDTNTAQFELIYLMYPV